MENLNLKDLILVPEEKRGPQWEIFFFHRLSEGFLDLLSEEPQVGPDGWPYLLTQTSEHAKEPASNIMRWLSERGIGLVVNPRKNYPDYVFTYGMIWFFKETGYFYHTTDQKKIGPVEISANQKLSYGEPSPEYLPEYVRKILREFFRDQGLYSVKILMISEDGKNFDLAFSLESLGKPKKEEHQGIAEAISWFLPLHYSILIVSEEGLPPFFNL